MTKKDRIIGGLYGLIVGDALGVPVEFNSRESLKKNPVTGMRGYGTYNQPPGTWSDDSSMTLATMDCLYSNDGFSAEGLMMRFAQWWAHGKYTPFGQAFDIGNTTRLALIRFYNTTKIEKFRGLDDEASNGNGSLMRILPIALWKNDTRIIREASSLTHAHERSILACCIYADIIDTIIRGYDLRQAISIAYRLAQSSPEHEKYIRLLDLEDLSESDIHSSGYVVDTLEAALWCALTTDNYRDCVLKAVNLGEDTDTIAAIAGGLAGVMYGINLIPMDWIGTIQRGEYVATIIKAFAGWCNGD